MLKEKAIKKLKDLKRQFEFSIDGGESEYAEDYEKESLEDNKEIVQALNMAIKSLSE